MAASDITSQESLSSFATGLKQESDKTLLLDLAPELRNAIYGAVARISPAKLSRSSRPIGSLSAMIRVNKQVRHEFQSILLFVADIHTTVRNFNFSHVVTFINKASEAQLNALATVHHPASRKIYIELFFTNFCIDGTFDHMHKLVRWLNRANHPTKKGTKIDYQYLSDGSIPYKSHDFQADLAKLLLGTSGKAEYQRSAAELQKIRKAIRRGTARY